MLIRILLLVTAISVLNSCTEIKDTTELDSDDIQLFTSMPYSETNVDFVNRLTENLQVNILTFEYFYNGGGVALGDINNDGLTDIYLTGNMGPNRLFLNLGNWKFNDITQTAGVDGGRGWSNGTCMVDINNDGWLDIYVCRSGNLSDEAKANQLFINNGNNTFTNKAKEYGLDDPSYSTHAAFFDYDLDGDLDMYLLNHNIEFGQTTSSNELQYVKGKYVADKLFNNDNGKFVDVSEKAGLRQNVISYGLGVAVSDVNNDSYPDLYVTNDYVERDYLYINNGDGTFRDDIKTALKHTSNSSMGCDIADINNDGLSDIFVLDMAAEDNYRSKTNMSGMNPERFWRTVNNGFHHQYMTNTLHLNNGNNTFSEISEYAGVNKTDWSWASIFADFDNDGWKDLIITNGYRKALRNNDFVKEKRRLYKLIDKDPNVNVGEILEKLLTIAPADKIANYAYRNNGDLTFTKKTETWGFGELSFSNGAARADLDNDGDLDLVINNIDQASFLFRNNAEKLKNDNYIKLKLNGSSKNRQGIGSKVIIKTKDNQQVVEFYPTNGYLSSMEHLVHFGLGKEKSIDELQIIWPDKKTQTLQNVKANQLLTLDYKNARTVIEKTPSNTTLFEDITNSADINFVHIENEYDDFEKEILLPHKMSTLGPCVAVGDVNNDGLDDFYIGGAMNQAGELFIQTAANSFVKQNTNLFATDKKSEDMGASFFDSDNDGDLDLYVSSGGSEVEEGSPLLLDRLYINDGTGNFIQGEGILPAISISSSCVKPFDFDGDGDKDLFVGGRMTPGEYPFPANSYIFENVKGKFKDVTADLAPELKDIGMVTSALWTDINNDKQVDLVLVGEWMPITVFLNDNSKFSKKEIDGLENSSGWWFSLSELDIDGDGDKDMVAGNLGLNYKYHTSPQEPFQIYCHDFDSSGTLDIYLGYFQDGNLFPVRGRECSSQQMPFVTEKFRNYDAFGKATLPEVLGEAANEALNYKASTFATSIIENQGDGTFIIKKLPAEAQFSSVNGIVIEDVNSDNKPDLIIAGNMYGSEVETPRNDASYGLVLLNDGSGGFEPMSITESGFLADGDVKAIELIELADKSKAILIAKNNDKLTLLKLNKVSQ